jgi:hypothetical protein
MSFLVYVLGGALLAGALHWWRPQVGWGWIAGYWLLAGTFFAAPLTTGALQVPSDIAYLWEPWREMLPDRIIPKNMLLGDVPLQMIPFHALTQDRLLHFEAPLWANELGTGQPLLGNAQSAPFSVFRLLSLPLPPVRALAVEAALRLFVSLFLTHALLLALGAGRAGSLLAALAFTFSVFSICWAFHPHGFAIGWLPGIVLGVVLLYLGERGGAAGLVGCTLAMAATGHPETLAHTAFAVGVLSLVLAFGGGGVGRWKFLSRLSVAVLIAAGLAAPLLLPVLEVIPEGVRAAAIRPSNAGVEPTPFKAETAIVTINPLAFGSPRDLDWSGPATLNFNELCSGYAGLLTLGLALSAAVVLRGRLLAIVLGGLIALGAAFGVRPFLQLFEAIPPLDHAANGRLRFVFLLAVAVGAGLGLEPVLASRRGRSVTGVVCGGLAVALSLSPRPASVPWQRTWWLCAVGGCAMTAAACLWLAWRAPESGGPSSGAARSLRWLVWLPVACLGLDLGLLNARFLPVLPAVYDLAPPPALAELMAASARSETPFRISGDGRCLLPNLSALYGLWDPRGNDPMQLTSAAEVVGRAFLDHYTLGAAIVLTKPSPPLPMLRYLGVRYLLTRHREDLDPPWQEVWEGAGGKIWLDPGALPLFFMPSSWRAVETAREALFSTLGSPDFSQQAVVEHPEGVPSNLPLPALGARLRRVRLEHSGANSFDLTAVDPGGGLVVSSVSYTSGWRLTIDARPAPILRVNSGFLGFVVPPRWQHAKLEYRPSGWVWGIRVFVTTLLALTVGALIGSVRRRRRPLSPAHPHPSLA